MIYHKTEYVVQYKSQNHWLDHPVGQFLDKENAIWYIGKRKEIHPDADYRLVQRGYYFEDKEIKDFQQ